MLWGRVAQYPNESEYPPALRGLVGAWCPALQNPAGTTIYDLSRYGNHGTLTNMDPPTDWVYGSNGYQCLDFDGSNDFVALSSSFNFRNDTPFAFTWFSRRTSTAVNWILGNGADNFSLLMMDNPAGTVRLRDSGNNGFTWTTSTVSDGAWHCYVVTYESLRVARLYVDGSDLGTQSVGGTTDTPVNAIAKRFAAGVEFNGQLNDIRVYNRLWTAQEAMRLTRGGPGYGLRVKRTRVYFGSSASSFNPAWARNNNVLLGV